jgi:hypothetical protein
MTKLPKMVRLAEWWARRALAPLGVRLIETAEGLHPAAPVPDGMVDAELAVIVLKNCRAYRLAAAAGEMDNAIAALDEIAGFIPYFVRERERKLKDRQKDAGRQSVSTRRRKGAQRDQLLLDEYMALRRRRPDIHIGPAATLIFKAHGSRLGLKTSDQSRKRIERALKKMDTC